EEVNMSARRVLQGILRSSLVLLSAAAAQAQLLNRGAIEGITTDPQGAFVPQVEVTITSLDTSTSQTVKTNTSGYYRVVDLVPGKSRAHFEARGFAPVDATEIEVPAGEVIKLDAQLKLGTTRELVRVTAEAPLLETSASNFSTSLETRTVQEMPM